MAKINALPKTTLESIIPFRKIPYWIFWPALGILYLGVFEFLLFRFAEPSDFLLAESVFIGVSIATWPLCYIGLAKYSQPTLLGLAKFIEIEDKNLENWLLPLYERVFTLKSQKAKLITFSVATLGIATAVYVGKNLFTEIILNIWFLIFFSIFAFIGGFGSFIVIEGWAVFNEISSMPIKIPFSRLPHPAISRIQTYGFLATLAMTYAYSSLVAAIWLSGISLSVLIIVWMTIWAFYPFGTFVYTIYSVHSLLCRVKESHLDIINAKVQMILSKIDQGNLKHLDELNKALEIQSKIQGLPEWAFNLTGIFTFLISSISVVIQIIVAIMNL